jgi:hypothetical protein
MSTTPGMPITAPWAGGREAMKFLTLCSMLFCLVLFTGGCSSINVHSDYDPAADFTDIHTYAWGSAGDSGDALSRDPLLKKRIQAAIDRYLRSRGYTLVDPEQADVLIVIQAVIKEKMQVTDWGGPGGFYRNPWYDPWWGVGAYGGRVDVSYYHEGTLIIDIVDNAKKELIWRGLGTGIVQRYSDREKQRKAVDEYVTAILDRFPPGHEKEQK